MEEKLFAHVIVDVLSSAVDKIFVYETEDASVLGHRVLVPFGTRIVEGYVLKVDNSAKFSGNIKKIIKKVDGFAILNEERLAIVEFMRVKFHLKYIDILRLFLPSELRTNKVGELFTTYFSLNKNINLEQYSNSLRKNSKNIFSLLIYLKEHKSEKSSVLSKLFTHSALDKLKKDKVLIEEKFKIERSPEVLNHNFINVEHTKYQKHAIQKICQFENKTILLHGVTGSGKTEVYLSCIEKALANGKSAILLVPEISLTPIVLAALKSRFGNNVAILHSGLSAGERFDEWSRILNQEAKVVIGARSAIFAPLENIGIIIIDEEHDSSYQSDSNPRYLTHDIAKFRCQFNNCPLVLASATPSIEHFYCAQNGVFELVSLPTRVNNRPLPEITIVDMLGELQQGNTSIFSNVLLGKLQKTIKEKKQAMLFINRRGFSSFMMCRECGYIAKCNDCDVSLVYHKHEEKLKCHYCGKTYKALTVCPQCHSESIKQGAVGTEQVVDRLSKIFPDVKILRMDNDTTKNKNGHMKILSEFANTKPAILVGTQMIAKGHDFKDVTFVGIIDADQSLFHSDYKSAEKTFQLVTQVSGRAGREKSEGSVVLQTYCPKHYVYRFATNYDYEGFYNKEINLRQTTHFPPFSTIVRLLFSSENDKILLDIVKSAYAKVSALYNSEDFIYLSVMKSPISRIKNKHRYQILMRISKNHETQILEKLYQICDEVAYANVSIFVEVNPQNLN